MRGELVGINEAKSSSSSSGASVDNIGFAIPINKAQDSLQEMMNQETRERVDESEASYIGIQGQDVSTQISELYGIRQALSSPRSYREARLIRRGWREAIF